MKSRFLLLCVILILIFVVQPLKPIYSEEEQEQKTEVEYYMFFPYVLKDGSNVTLIYKDFTWYRVKDGKKFLDPNEYDTGGATDVVDCTEDNLEKLGGEDLENVEKTYNMETLNFLQKHFQEHPRDAVFFLLMCKTYGVSPEFMEIVKHRLEAGDSVWDIMLKEGTIAIITGILEKGPHVKILKGWLDKLGGKLVDAITPAAKKLFDRFAERFPELKEITESTELSKLKETAQKLMKFQKEVEEKIGEVMDKLEKDYYPNELPKEQAEQIKDEIIGKIQEQIGIDYQSQIDLLIRKGIEQGWFDEKSSQKSLDINTILQDQNTHIALDIATTSWYLGTYELILYPDFESETLDVPIPEMEEGSWYGSGVDNLQVGFGYTIYLLLMLIAILLMFIGRQSMMCRYTGTRM